MKNTIKLTRIYPDFSEPDIKKIASKALLNGLLPIEPIMELGLYSATYLSNKLSLLIGNKPEDYIEFTKEEIIIKEADQKNTFQLKDIQGLKINYSNLWHSRNQMQLDEKSNDLAKVSFRFNEASHEYYYDSPKKAVQKICVELYAKKYKFKEYSFGKRVFLGKQPNYKRVQEIKAEYGIAW